MIQRGARHSKLSSNFIGSPRLYINQWAALHRGTATTTKQRQYIVCAPSCTPVVAVAQVTHQNSSEFPLLDPHAQNQVVQKKKQVLQGPITGVHTVTLSFATLRSLVTAATAYLPNRTSCPSCSYHRRSCAASVCSVWLQLCQSQHLCYHKWPDQQVWETMVCWPVKVAVSQATEEGGVVPVSHGQFSLSPQTEVPSAGKR